MAHSTGGRIPPEFIADLLARVDIVDVVERRVPLKKSGRNLLARCPFHEEKTPSFSVNREKQFYYCFGCRASGSAIGFLMEYDGLGFVDAVEELAARAGLEVPRTGGAARPGGSGAPGADAVYATLERANRHYRRQLREHPERARAVDYLKSRGVSGEAAAHFELGYAPPGWEGLAAALGEPPEALERAGLAVRREGSGSRYDRFRDRVTFPIRDRRGRVVGFGGRVVGDGEPKYLNSPDGPVFHKGRELYGLHRVLGGGRGKPRRLVVVEGYMDVVALAESGVEGVVATLGTAATREHLHQLYRAAQEVVFCFDGDAAGRSAAWRALEQALPLMRETRRTSFLFLPEGEDPDSFVRTRGREAFEAALETAAPLSDFLFSTLRADADPATVEGRARFMERAAALVASVPPGAFRTALADRTAEIARLPHEEVQALVHGAERAGGSERRSASGGGGGTGSGAGAARPAANGRSGKAGGGRRRPTIVRQAIRLLLHHPSLAADERAAEETAGVLDGLDMNGAGLLAELLRTAARAEGGITTAALVERYREHEAGRHLARLAGEPPLIEEGLEADFNGMLVRLCDMALGQRLGQLHEKVRSGTAGEAEKREYRRLLAERSRTRSQGGSG